MLIMQQSQGMLLGLYVTKNSTTKLTRMVAILILLVSLKIFKSMNRFNREIEDKL